MKHENFLIEASIGNAKRKLVWNGEEPIKLDHPNGWVVEKLEDGVRLRDMTLESEMEQMNTAVVIPTLEESLLYHVDLPPAAKGNPNRALSVNVSRLKPLRPVYEPLPSEDAVQTGKPLQLYMFYGLRYFMVHYRPVGNEYNAHVGETGVFTYRKTSGGYEIKAHQEGLKFKVDDQKVSLKAGEVYSLSAQAFFSTNFIFGVHWWRFQRIPIVDSLPPLVSDQSEDDLRELIRFRKSLQVFGVLFLVMTVFLINLSRNKPEEKIVSVTNVELKQPKILPKKEEPKKEEPKKVVEKPKPVDLDKPKPVVKKPEPKPKKIVEKKPAPPKKMAAQPKAPEKSNKVTPPPTVKSPAPPNPGIVAKVPTPAPPAPNPEAQVLKSLSFLSSSNNKPMAGVPNYDNKNKNFKNTPTVGGGSMKSNVLDNISNTAVDTNINTKSARAIASGINFGKGKGKGLNEVQGKVSSSELYDPNAKFTFESGGMSVSGPGQLNETAIEKALSKFLTKFQFCYEKALLKDASLSGNIVMKWTINTSGKASDPKVVNTQMHNEDLTKCIGNVLLSVPFPAPKGGSVTVSKTFTFKSSTL